RRLTVYSRYGCHLCTDMLQALARLQPVLDFKFTVLDVDGEPELARRYGDRVPVLLAGETELCCHFLDEDRLREYYRSC
ncbi:MAG TPA: glutaredoxin family protein, partial [Fibrobacteraceae bacterium]|nr:glutaredoxin family protein [Fibrobacteraceae bacterium]